MSASSVADSIFQLYNSRVDYMDHISNPLLLFAPFFDLGELAERTFHGICERCAPTS